MDASTTLNTINTETITQTIEAQQLSDDQTAAQNAQYQIMADYLSSLNDATSNIQGDASQIPQK